MIHSAPCWETVDLQWSVLPTKAIVKANHEWIKVQPACFCRCSLSNTANLGFRYTDIHTFDKLKSSSLTNWIFQ